VAGVALRPDGRQFGCLSIQSDEGPLVSGSAACAHTVRSIGPVDPVLPRVAPALALTLN